MGNFQTNKFYFIFSDAGISRIDDHFSEFKYKWDGFDPEFIDVNSKKDFINILRKIKTECSELDVKPFIHFECHGSKNGLVLKSTGKVFWSELLSYLTKINVACGNHLFTSFSSCYGGYLTFPLLEKAAKGQKNRAPVFGLIGPSDEISFGEVREGFDEFFKTILENNSIDDGIKKLEEKISKSSGYVIVTCEAILKELLNGLLKMDSERKFRSKIQFNAFLLEQAKQYLFTTGTFISKSDFEKLAEISSSKKLYLDFFKGLQSYFLMFDLYPENINRFGQINDINNWDDFISRIR